MGTTPGGNNLFDGFTTGATKQVTGLNGQTLYCRVRAVNGMDMVSSWSLVSVPTTIDTIRPAPPGIPQDAGAYTSRTLVTFRWTAAADGANGSAVASYDLQVGTARGTSNVFNGNVGLALNRTVGGANSQTLYARVRARDRAGNIGLFSSDSDGITVDTVRPRLISVRPRNPQTLDVAFSEPVRNADPPSIYSCTGGLRILTVTQLTPAQYRLGTSKQTARTSYTLTVGAAVTDRAGNGIDPAYRSRSFMGGSPAESRSWELYR